MIQEKDEDVCAMCGISLKFNPNIQDENTGLFYCDKCYEWRKKKKGK